VKTQPTAFNYQAFLAPPYWPTWLIMGLMRLLATLPYAWQLRVGKVLGWILYWLAPSRRRIARINIDLAFPQLSPQEKQQLLLKNFYSNGMALLEIGMAWWKANDELRPLLHLEGMEHLQEALKAGKGVIMLGGHFTCLIIAGRLLTMELSFNAIAKQGKNPLFEALMLHYREQQYEKVIDNHDMRGILKALRNNEICWYGPDQDFGAKRSVFAPFMGVQTATLTTTAKLAKSSGAKLVYIDYERMANGKGYHLRIYPALEDYPSGDDVADATRVNQLIEILVRSAPDQYLWAHRRFRSRPNKDDKKFY
jgi:KDO2-lipid IV(A) lauroyltransferase